MTWTTEIDFVVGLKVQYTSDAQENQRYFEIKIQFHTHFSQACN